MRTFHLMSDREETQCRVHFVKKCLFSNRIENKNNCPCCLIEVLEKKESAGPPVLNNILREKSFSSPKCLS